MIKYSTKREKIDGDYDILIRTDNPFLLSRLLNFCVYLEELEKKSNLADNSD